MSRHCFVFFFFFKQHNKSEKLSLTQEVYLCSCYWIMSFKQVSNTRLLKQQTVHFQFPKSWRCVPPSQVLSPLRGAGPSCPVCTICNTVARGHEMSFCWRKLSDWTFSQFGRCCVGGVLQMLGREFVAVPLVATRGQLCTGGHEARCDIKHHTSKWGSVKRLKMSLSTRDVNSEWMETKYFRIRLLYKEWKHRILYICLNNTPLLHWFLSLKSI